MPEAGLAAVQEGPHQLHGNYDNDITVADDHDAATSTDPDEYDHDHPGTGRGREYDPAGPGHNDNHDDACRGSAYDHSLGGVDDHDHAEPGDDDNHKRRDDYDNAAPAGCVLGLLFLHR